MSSQLLSLTILLVVFIVLYLLFTAADHHTHAAPQSRDRPDNLPRGQSQADALAAYITRRFHQLACIAWARLATLVGAAAIALVGLAPSISEDGWDVLATGLVLVVTIGIAQGFVRESIERNPDGWNMVASVASYVARIVFTYPALLLDAPARFLVGGVRQGTKTREAEELLRLVEMEEEAGSIEEDEREMIRGVISLTDTLALDVMIPRTDLVAVDMEATFEDVTRIILEQGKSRIPLFQETIDRIVGVVYAKDVLRCLAERKIPSSLREIAREPHFIPETKRVDELLAELRSTKVHFAVVVDEYGGTAGIVTIEDVLEEIVGEIDDEYDVAERSIEKMSDTQVRVNGRVPIGELEEIFDIEISHEDFDTVAGLVFSSIGRIPAAGDEVEVGPLHLRVLSVAGRRIKEVLVTLLPETDTLEDQPQTHPA